MNDKRPVVGHALVLGAALFACAAAADVVVNELHYEPAVKTDLAEFIELYNNGTGTVDLSGWRFERGVAYTFPASTELVPGAFLVVAEDPGSLSNLYGTAALGPYEGLLANEGERLTLRDAAGSLIDEVTYRSAFPWPLAAAGGGSSMELIHPSLDNDRGGSWRASGYPGLAAPTPGATNSVWSTNAPPAIRQVHHEPEQPGRGEPVLLTAKISDADGITNVSLSVQIVVPGAYLPAYLPLSHSTLIGHPDWPLPENPAFEDAANWAEQPMTDDGTGADMVAGDHIYSAQLAGQPTNRTLVRYRVRAYDAQGTSVRAPLFDDPSLNFAYFVYDGVPAYTTTARSVHPDGVGHVYGTNVTRALPVYWLLSRSNDLAECIAYELGDQIATVHEEARDKFNWEGAFVYDGEVYDHIRYRLRQHGDRYGAYGKRAMRIRFRTGRYLQARDRYGRKYETDWRTLNIGKLFDAHRENNYGITETLNNELWNLCGVPAPYMHPFHFRVVDSPYEAPPGTNGQYYGDFWGMFLATEDFDARFLDAHGLPDGNLYKFKQAVTNGLELRRNQGRYSVTNDWDYQNIHSNCNPAATEPWLREYINYDLWYRYHSICEAVRHYDIRYSLSFKNRAWYFDMSATNRYGRLWVLPHDSDASWGPNWNSGEDFPWYGICKWPDEPVMRQEYRNVIREFRDLVWTEEVIHQMIDELAAPITEFALADRDRWKDAPPDAGYQDWAPTSLVEKVQSMKGFAFAGWTGDSGPDVPAGGRAAHLDSLAESKGDGTNIPYTATLVSIGPTNFAVNALAFECSAFDDPQGSNTFAAMAWRLGEITDTNSPCYEPAAPICYEIVPVWQSGVLTAFVNTVAIPSGVTQVGHTYRARVRMQDMSGRWSHWSAPVQFTAGAPDNDVALAGHLRVTELMYYPPAGSDYEFLELHNTSGDTVLDLAGARIEGGIEFTFAAGATLSTGAYLLVVRADPTNDFATFKTHYGLGAEVPVAGPYSGRLSNDGEPVRVLSAAGGTVLASLDYNDGAGWPTAADGAGHSLVPLQQQTQDTGLLDYGGHWRASARIGGSPGRADPDPVTDLLVNELMAHTDYTNGAPWQDSNDWIELFNAGDTLIALGDWYLSDDRSDLTKWRVTTTNLAPGAFVTFAEVTDFHTNATTGFGLNKAGEAVFLSYLPGNTNDRVADAVRFDAQEPDRSYGRFPDGGPNWYALVPTPDTTNGLPEQRAVFSRLMVEPAPTPAHPADNTFDEYVELYNPGEAPVDLWNAVGPWRVTGQVEFMLPAGLSLGAKHYLVIVSFDPTNTTARSAFLSTYGLGEGEIQLQGPWAGNLANGGGRLALQRPQSGDGPTDPVSWVTVDELVYFHAQPWPDGTEAGRPLARKTMRWAGSAPGSWYAATEPGPGPVCGLYATNQTPKWWLLAAHADWTNEFDTRALGDFDLDGLATWAEYIAGTDPTNPASCFVLRIGQSNGAYTVWFDGVRAEADYDGATRYYWLDRGSSLTAADWSVQTGYNHVPGGNRPIVHSEEPASNRAVRFHKARVRLE